MNNMQKLFIDAVSDETACNLMISRVVSEMRTRLTEKRQGGHKGWQYSEVKSADIKQALVTNLNQSDWIDVINYAAMLWMREQLYGPAGPQALPVKLRTAIEESTALGRRFVAESNKEGALHRDGIKQGYEAVLDYLEGREKELV